MEHSLLPPEQDNRDGLIVATNAAFLRALLIGNRARFASAWIKIQCNKISRFSMRRKSCVLFWQTSEGSFVGCDMESGMSFLFKLVTWT